MDTLSLGCSGYCVFVERKNAPTVVHLDKISACKEADRLALFSLNRRVFVVHIIGYALNKITEKCEYTWVDL